MQSSFNSTHNKSNQTSDYSEDEVFTDNASTNYTLNYDSSGGGAGGDVRGRDESTKSAGSKIWSIVSSVFRLASFSDQSGKVVKSNEILKRSGTYAGKKYTE